MIHPFRQLSIGIAFLLATVPVAAAQGNTTPCPPARTHSLPTGTNPTVFTFGVKGGNIRPWSVKVLLDGTIKAAGITTSQAQLNDAQHTLAGLLTLAEAEGFFSMKKTVGCLGSGGNPDVGFNTISIHTSQNTKTVRAYGNCAATMQYDQLYAVLKAAVGIGA